MSEARKSGPRPRPLAERFKNLLEADPATGCVNFTGCINALGYGQIGSGGKRGAWVYAHRLGYELAKGPIPDGLVIDHLCRNRRCCNPDHLEVVTRGENVLRGMGASVRNAGKTHCPQGHPYDAGNTKHWMQDGRPVRRCIACEGVKDAKRRLSRAKRRTASGVAQ
jgi:hypothetical protein